ncbi:hypothetical protein ROLI_011240 [Roseobacter fucihabitans]|uniref:Uncharacterized protein n=1 Tax=Roseobacter fucihabitans TaxID=1537242 RepID=A0ABZ2BPY5_9RHOB|nr:hypothetical protein [Roseobacter litoralis]
MSVSTITRPPVLVAICLGIWHRSPKSADPGRQGGILGDEVFCCGINVTGGGRVKARGAGLAWVPCRICQLYRCRDLSAVGACCAYGCGAVLGGLADTSDIALKRGFLTQMMRRVTPEHEGCPSPICGHYANLQRWPKSPA